MNAVVYVDIDDVLCETARRLMRLLNDRFGRSVQYEEITTFDLEVAFSLDAEQTRVLSELFHDPGVLTALDPVDGAAATLGRWRAAGIEVDIVTGRPPVTDGPTRDWLAAHRVPYDRLFYMDKFNRGNAAMPGTDILTAATLRERPYAFAVDDAVPMIRFFAETTTVPVVVFDRPWNRNCAAAVPCVADGAVHRCRSWADIESLAADLLARAGEVA